MMNTYTKRAQFVTSIAAVLACASIAQAAPAGSKNKTVHIREIHRDHSTPRMGRPVPNSLPLEEAILFRSRAELAMINPG